MGEDTDDEVLIECDSRELKSGVPQLLAQMQDAAVRQLQLEDGDYRVGGGVLIERKALPDFLTCIRGQTLGEQLDRLVEAAQVPVLIVEGPLFGRTGPDTKIDYETRRSVLSYLVQFRDVWVIQSESQQQTAEWIFTIARQAQHGAKPLPAHPGKSRPAAARQLNLLRAIPAIGSGRATMLLEHYGNLARIFAAPEENLAQVVGRAAARSVRKFFEATAAATPIISKGRS